MTPKRIIFMGTPAFSCETLNGLIASGHDVVAVYTQPPKAQDRGHHVKKSAIHQLADAHNIPVYTPKSLRSAEEADLFRSHNADLAVVVAYGLLLPASILEAPRLGCVNIHASLLPRWRGAAPIQRALMAGDTKTGITLMQMDIGLDTGNMLATAEVSITVDTTVSELHDQLAFVGANLLKDNVGALLDQVLEPVVQPIEGVTYAAKLEKSEGLLSWAEPADRLSAKIRALNPWPGTWFVFEDMPIKVIKAEIINLPESDALAVGVFFKNAHYDICVVCGDGTALALQILQRPGGKSLPAKDFLAGMPSLRTLLIG